MAVFGVHSQLLWLIFEEDLPPLPIVQTIVDADNCSKYVIEHINKNTVTG
jgi:hypothetical protein